MQGGGGNPGVQNFTVIHITLKKSSLKKCWPGELQLCTREGFARSFGLNHTFLNKYTSVIDPDVLDTGVYPMAVGSCMFEKGTLESDSKIQIQKKGIGWGKPGRKFRGNQHILLGAQELPSRSRLASEENEEI